MQVDAPPEENDNNEEESYEVDIDSFVRANIIIFTNDHSFLFSFVIIIIIIIITTIMDFRILTHMPTVTLG